MPDSNQTTSTTTSEPPKVYVCQWAGISDVFGGTIEMILNEYTDLNFDVEEWYSYIYIGHDMDQWYLDKWGGYTTDTIVTIEKFHRDSRVLDKIVCDNMTIKRVA